MYLVEAERRARNVALVDPSCSNYGADLLDGPISAHTCEFSLISNL